MQFGYVLLTRAAPNEGEQRAALKAAGVAATDIHVDKRTKGRRKPGEDPFPQRTAVINRLKKGDELVIQKAARLGITLGDILTALVEIGKKQAAVFDLEASRRVAWHPDAQETVAFLQRAEVGQRYELTARMREVKTQTGEVGGKPSKYSADQLAVAEQHWRNTELTTVQAVELAGIPERTLYHHFGKRGTPDFGRAG